ncbi:MAG: F0F1 ATP synthase subunit delta, partial [Deltaproteobacteria bacterium]|nr:F0F1 ATP synthase subunit delta [Deltaproteobacteria bacterium]
MSVSALTRRYAKALVELGVEKKSVDRYGDELAMITEVFAQQPLISQLLESPTL